MEVKNGNGKGKAVIGILSTVLLAVGGYSFDTITTTVESTRELTVKMGKLESRIDALSVESGKGERFTQQDGDNLVARIERLELRVDGIVHNRKKE